MTDRHVLVPGHCSCQLL